MAETLPVNEDLSAFIDTDNEWDFPIEDENGVRLDVTGWTANLEVAENVGAVPKLVATATPTADPLDAAETVLRVTVEDADLQPGTGATQWLLADYVYSLKRTNDTREKILRYGAFHMLRARR